MFEIPKPKLGKQLLFWKLLNFVMNCLIGEKKYVYQISQKVKNIITGCFLMTE